MLKTLFSHNRFVFGVVESYNQRTFLLMSTTSLAIKATHSVASYNVHGRHRLLAEVQLFTYKFSCLFFTNNVNFIVFLSNNNNNNNNTLFQTIVHMDNKKKIKYNVE